MTDRLKKTKLDLDNLEMLYREAEEVDKDLFAEQRTNLLLVAGEHYQKRHATFFRRIKDSKDLSEQQKIRLTKNHIQKICKLYVNHITSAAPGVGIEPKNESELQDQKAAELNHSVWQDINDRHRINAELVDDWGEDFFNIGELAVKIFWDPAAGKVKAYEQKMSEEGVPLFLDEAGEETEDSVPGPDGQPTRQPAPGNPQYSGDFILETIHGFNLLRDPEARDLRTSPYLITRKMVEVKELKARFPDSADKIKVDGQQTMVVFDAVRGGYVHAKNQVMLKEIYFRPCSEFPKGKFVYWVTDAKLIEDNLPGGIFPIKTALCERIQTSPRGRSIIKTMRPYQAEINRMASKMAEHQMTLGDDKLLVQNGTKITSGAALPGVRSIQYTGMQPGILQGRTGEQYLALMQAQIEELYQVMNVSEIMAEKDGQADPYLLLFRAASDKRKFVRYVKRFEQFQVEVARTALELAKIHYSDDTLIYAVGKKEQVNIPEFRNTEELCYQIKLVPQADDIESKLGKQLVLNHALQYVGNKLEKEDIGRLMRAMPYANGEDSFEDLTLDSDAAQAMLLSLDRGERPPISPYDNFVYMIKRLTGRMRKKDFDFLPQPVQNNYRQALQMFQKMEVKRQQEILRAQQGYIPTGGYMVRFDLYVPDPKDPTKTKRGSAPYQALEWLMKKLEDQGLGMEQLEQMNEGALAEMSGMMHQSDGGPSNGMGVLPSPQDQERSGRVENESGNQGRYR